MTSRNDHDRRVLSCSTRSVEHAWPEESSHRTFFLAGVLLLGLVAAAGCAGDGESAEPAAPSPTPGDAVVTPTADTPEPSWPMTGLPAPGGVADRPVLAVKVDNTDNARPQVGLADADVVVEEPVEGGLTRLAAMYHSALPEAVVPVRSIRTTDVGLVGPIDGALVASGGASLVLDQTADADIPVLAEGTAGFSRDPERPDLYSLTADLSEMVDEVPGRLGPPPLPYLEWSDREPPEGSKVTNVVVQFSGSHATTHVWDGSAWLRDGGMAAPGEEFAASNLLVLHTTTRDAGYTDPAGNPVDEVVFDAGGEALVLAGDTAIEATWSHGGDAVFTLTASSGQRLTVPPGRTWIALVPERGTVTPTE